MEWIILEFLNISEKLLYTSSKCDLVRRFEILLIEIIIFRLL